MLLAFSKFDFFILGRIEVEENIHLKTDNSFVFLFIIILNNRKTRDFSKIDKMRYSGGLRKNTFIK